MATCDRGLALCYLQKVYPGRSVTDTKASAGPILDFIANRVVKLDNPDGTAIQGTIRLRQGPEWHAGYRPHTRRASAILEKDIDRQDAATVAKGAK